MALITDSSSPDVPAQTAHAGTLHVAVDALAVLLLAVAVCGIALLRPVGHVDPVVLITGVVLYATAWRITFAVGSGAATPLQLVFVPVWFLLPPAMLPVVAVGGQLLAAAVGHRFGDRARTGESLVSHAADAWHSVAPALLFTLVGPQVVGMRESPLVIVAVVAQVATWSAVSALRRSAKGLPQPERRAPRVVAANSVVDIALAAFGLELAIVASDALWAIALVLPFMGMLAYFARERDSRMDQALALSSAYRGTAALMADVLEADDEYTGGEHTKGVVDMALRTGEVLDLDVAAMRNLEFGALLHDIGKLRVPNEIINKPGKLSALEWEIIKQHPEIGEAMLARVGGVLAEAGPIVRGHHERFDGCGYPDGLAGQAIPVEARIITVCDSFSAMTTDRSYRRAMSEHEAIAELHRCTPGQFDPAVVQALVIALDLDPDQGLHVAAEVHRPHEDPAADAPASETTVQATNAAA